MHISKGAALTKLVAALAIGVLGAVVGGLIARAIADRPLIGYRSESLLRLSQVEPHLMRDDTLRPAHEALMREQELIIRSRRVFDTAVDDPIWKANGLSPGRSPEEFFGRSLTVTADPRGALLRISFVHSNAGTAAAATSAITNAYKDWYRRYEEILNQERTGMLEIRATSVSQQLKRSEAVLAAAIAEQGGETMLEGKLREAERLQAALDDALVAADAANASTAAKSAATTPATLPGDRLVRLRQLADQARRDATAAERTKLSLTQMRNEADSLRAELARLDARMAELRTDGAFGSRFSLSVISSAEIPLSRSIDREVLLLTLVGVAAGALGGVLLSLCGMVAMRILHGEVEKERVKGVEPSTSGLESPHSAN